MVRSLIWIAGATIVFVGVFGITPLLAGVAYICLFLFSACIVVAVVSMKRSPQVFDLKEPLPFPSNGIKSILKNIRSNDPVMKLDRRLTGAKLIDEPLQQVLDLLFRDYIETWYSEISKDPEFLVLLRSSIQKTIVSFSNHAKEVDWVSFITKSTVKEIVEHLKRYRATVKQAEVDAAARTRKDINNLSDVDISTVSSIFFERWGNFAEICSNPAREAEYLRDLSEVILYFLLPESDFQSKSLRFLLRELIASTVLKPTVNMLSDPDYINQTIVLWVSDDFITLQTILDLARTTQSVEDLHVMFARVEEEIQRNVIDGSAKIKQHVDSILFAKRECENRHKELTGTRRSSMYEHYELSTVHRDIPLSFFLENNNALLYFQEFMEAEQAKDMLDFYVNANTFEIVAKLKIRDVETNQLPAIRAEIAQQASELFAQYIGDSAPRRLDLPSNVLAEISAQLEAVESPEQTFLAVQEFLLKKFETKYFPRFMKSTGYVRCQIDEENIAGTTAAPSSLTPNLDPISEDAGEHTDAISFDMVQPMAPDHDFQELVVKVDPEGTWQADIESYQTQKETSKSKSVTVYKIHVVHTSTSTGMHQDFAIWRRFSDFDDVHRQIKQKSPRLRELVLPEKTLFSNHSTEFLSKRKDALQDWLKIALLPENMANMEIREPMVKFLMVKAYTRQNINIAKRLVQDVSAKVKEATSRRPQVKVSEDPDASTVGLADYDPRSIDDEDNIPFKIIISLLDELFELSSNQWLRKKIMSVIRHIIRTAMGDSINKRIVESIEALTSTEQVAVYVNKLKDSMWPDGTLAPPDEVREKTERAETRVEAKIRMLSMIPDDLKRLVGSQTAKKGILRLVDMFQHPDLNKRLVYVTLESFLSELFPESKIGQALRKLQEVKARRLF